jgi:hypothetical protein
MRRAAPPTLAERYAVAVTWGIIVDLSLFFLSTLLLIGIINGSGPWWAWVVILAAEGISLFVGFWLGVLYLHDREIMHPSSNPQGRGEVA